jgi:hypothetical protein
MLTVAIVAVGNFSRTYDKRLEGKGDEGKLSQDDLVATIHAVRVFFYKREDTINRP